MTPLSQWTIVAVCLTVLAMFVPWAYYGDIDVELSRLPLWWAYLGAAVLLHLCALLPARVGLVFLVVPIAAAVVVAIGYDDASAVFDHVVPAVRPRPGVGVLFAVASAVAQGVGLRTRVRVPA